MTEETGRYDIGPGNESGSVPISKQAKLLYSDPEYNSPSPAEITTVIRLTGLSSAEVGKIIGVDSRNVRRYKSGQIKIMPYAAWRLLLLYLGQVTVETKQ